MSVDAEKIAKLFLELEPSLIECDDRTKIVLINIADLLINHTVDDSNVRIALENVSYYLKKQVGCDTTDAPPQQTVVKISNVSC